MGASVVVFDAGDGAFRASRGNFGLVWAQSKGANNRSYATWTRRAVSDWPDLEVELEEITGLNTHYRSGPGVHICLTEKEFAARSRLVEQIKRHDLPGDDTRMIDREELTELLPGVGEGVAGASVSSLDGDCHSLSLYRALAEGFVRAGGRLLANEPVRSIVPLGPGYLVTSEETRLHADKVLIAAGLATNALAEPLGFPEMVRPQKGQILVSERTTPFMPLVASGIRQTPEGTVLIGDTKEDAAGTDDRSRVEGIRALATRAAAIYPRLRSVRIVRSWAALRVLTQDGDPVYDESPTHPGVFVATTHSGVTLAPVHRGLLAQWILHGQRPVELPAFTAQRFDKKALVDMTTNSGDLQ